MTDDAAVQETTIDEKQYIATLKCSACGAVIAKSKPVPEHDRLIVSLSSVFQGSCPNGCQPTFSDCNIRTDIEWDEVEETT